MSDDKRRLIRTQGRFSGNGFSERVEERENKYDKRHKGKKPNEKKSHEKHQSGEIPEDEACDDNSPNMKNRNFIPSNNFGVEYEYYEDDMPEIKLVKKPRLLEKEGWHIISDTENGESSVLYLENIIEPGEGYEMMDILRKQIKWYDKNIVIHGRELPQPRLVAWFGPLPYSYSGITLQPREFPDLVLKIKERVESALKEEDIFVNLNSVLLNLYRDGKDSVAWHSDDELSMGICPTIASVSLGEVRKFEMRPKYVEKRRYSGQSPQYERQLNTDYTADYMIYLKHGSLVVMNGAMQEDWQHRVPKEYHDKAARINLTFRTVFKIESVPYPRGGIARVSPPHSSKPKVSPPHSDKPKVSPPHSDKPKVSPPHSDKPKVSPPHSDKPKVSPPHSDKPKVSPPPSDKPKVSPPHSDKPKVSPKVSMPELGKDKYEKDFPEISPKEKKEVIRKEPRVDSNKDLDLRNNLNYDLELKTLDKKQEESSADCEICKISLQDIYYLTKILKQNFKNSTFSWRDQLEFEFLICISNCAEYLSSQCRTLLYNRLKFYQIVESDGWKVAKSYKFSSKHSCKEFKEASSSTSGHMNIPVHYNERYNESNLELCKENGVEGGGNKNIKYSDHDTELLDLIAAAESLMGQEEILDQDSLELQLVISVAKYNGYLPAECRKKVKDVLKRFSDASKYGWRYVQDSYVQHLHSGSEAFEIQILGAVNSNAHATLNGEADVSFSELTEKSGGSSPENMDVSEVESSQENLPSNSNWHKVQNNKPGFHSEVSNEYHTVEGDKSREIEFQRLITYIENNWDSPKWGLRDNFELNCLIPVAKHATLLPSHCQDLLIERLKYFEEVLNGRYRNSSNYRQYTKFSYKRNNNPRHNNFRD